MSASWQAITVLVALLATMAAYALFAGADFGGGIWDLLAGNSAQGRRAREAIDASVTPVWEGNQVWIVLGIVLLWTAFPAAFAAVTTALFIPLAFSLLGILLRGIGFAFRHESQGAAAARLNGYLFATSSLLASFFLGMSVGAVSTGDIGRTPAGNLVTAWTQPIALGTGAMFVAACAFIGGVYLVADSRRRGDEELERYFAKRAAAAGAATGALGALNLALLHHSDRYVFDRLFGISLPLVAISAAAGATTLIVVMLGRNWPFRLTAACAVAAVVAAWGLAQYPWLLPGALTVAAGSAPTTTLWAELAVIVMALVFVVPSFAWLYLLQQHNALVADSASHRLLEAFQRQNQTDHASTERARHPVVVAVLIGAAVLEMLRTRRRGA